jgi:protease-4
LVLDLNIAYNEQEKVNPLSSISGNESGNAPGLYDVVRMLHYAKTDSTIKGLYIKGGYNANGFASSEELRKAVLDFKGK